MEIAMEFATFCNICFNKNNLRKIEETEDLTRILMLFTENKILLKEQEVYLCFNCCEKLESYDKFKEMCLRNFIDFRIEYSELKKKLEMKNDLNMENKLRNFIETKVNRVNDRLNFDASEDPLNVEYNMKNSQKSDSNIPEKEDDYSYNLRNVKCKTEKAEYDEIEDYEFSTELDLESSKNDFEEPIPFEHMKIESCFEEDVDSVESTNEKKVIKQSTSTGPYETNNKSADPLTNLVQSKKQGSVVTLKKNERLTGKTRSDLACKICKKTFCKPSNLSRHMRTHTGEKPHTCAFCNKSFSHSNTLKRHVATHTGEKPWACGICGKTFAEKGNLRTHELVHTGERPYNCSFCQKPFRHLNHLKTHKRIHTGEKPYSCTVCDKKFGNGTAFRSHKLKHSNEKPYTCIVCNKSFKKLVHLREHEYTHTGVKPYSCEKCKKAFTWGSELRLHKKKPCAINVVEEEVTEETEKS